MIQTTEPPRRRSLAGTLHRWAGVSLALIAIWLAGTGVALNHAHDWALDRRPVRQDWILDGYGIAPSPPRAAFVTVDGRWISQVGRSVFVDARILTEFEPALTGGVRWQGQWVLAGEDRLQIVADDGTTVETLRPLDLPGKLTGLGAADGVLGVRTPAGWFETDATLLRWRRTGGDFPVTAARPPPAALAARVGLEARRHVLTWERVIADLHAGRFLARAGPFAVDAAAILLGVLGVSGLVLFARTRRRRPPPAPLNGNDAGPARAASRRATAPRTAARM